jgi:uncharacterized protein YbaR (Trm112 family)
VPLRIAKEKSHIPLQKLVKPCATEMAKLVCSKDKKLDPAYPIIKLMPFMMELDMSEDICRQVVQ